jgi:hypothetical protein
MKITFRRMRPRIEEAIANLPTSEDLWKFWLLAQACIDSQNYKFGFFDSIEAPPDVAEITWPPEGAIVPLTKYFFEQKNWDMVLRLTDTSYKELKNRINSQNNTAKRVPGFKIAIYIDWEGICKPTLSGLIMTSQQNEADEFVTLMYSTENGRTLTNSAIQTARSLGEANLANKWQSLMGGVS